MGLGWWSYAAIATYRIVMQSSAAERATMAALGVHELTKELFIWVAPGIVGHVVIWTLQKRRGPA